MHLPKPKQPKSITTLILPSNSRERMRTVLRELPLIWPALAGVWLVYLGLRLPFLDSFTFEYDMPRLALIVQDFLQRGSFLTSQSFYWPSHWDNVPWGPALVYYYAPFFKLSSEPLDVSLLVTLVNGLSVISLLILGWRFFSPAVGLLAALLLATQPFWVIFSRLIYQPTPVIPTICLAMLVTFFALKERQVIAQALLPVFWVVLIQLHLPTFGFVAGSLLVSAWLYKRFSLKALGLGFFLSLVLLVPSGRYYLDHPQDLVMFREAPSKFTPPEKTWTERTIRVVQAHFSVLAGGGFHWYLTTAEKDFFRHFGVALAATKLIGSLLLVSFAGGLLGAVWSREQRLEWWLLTFWAGTSLWFFSLFWTTDLTPRYFLMAMPASYLTLAAIWTKMAGWFVVKFGSWARLVWVLPVLVIIFWSVFDLKLHRFIVNYSYPDGRLADVFETPYLHLRQAMDWIVNDAAYHGYRQIKIANKPHAYQPGEQLQSVRYLSRYVYHLPPASLDPSKPVGYYLLAYTSPSAVSPDSPRSFRSGPFLVQGLPRYYQPGR